MRRTLLSALTLVALGLAAPAAWAGPKQVRYLGIHPVSASAGGGFCYIEGPHVHVFAADKLQYRDHRGHHVFVGDPVAYGYEGPRVAYKGHHPVHVDVAVDVDVDIRAEDPDIEYCYLDGPHYHSFAPPAGPDFVLAGDAYFYVAEPPKVYLQARPQMIAINAVYRPIVYARPVIEVDAPVGWIGARAELVAPAVVVPARPPVVRGGVGIDVRMPTVSIDVGVGVGIGAAVGVGVVGRGGPPPRRHVHHKHHKHKKHKKHKHRGR